MWMINNFFISIIFVLFYLFISIHFIHQIFQSYIICSNVQCGFLGTLFLDAERSFFCCNQSGIWDLTKCTSEKCNRTLNCILRETLRWQSTTRKTHKWLNVLCSITCFHRRCYLMNNSTWTKIFLASISTLMRYDWNSLIGNTYEYNTYKRAVACATHETSHML